MGVICAPGGGGENDGERIEDKVCSLRGHFRALKTAENVCVWDNGDESGQDKIGPGLKNVWIIESYPVWRCRGGVASHFERKKEQTKERKKKGGKI